MRRLMTVVGAFTVLVFSLTAMIAEGAQAQRWSVEDNERLESQRSFYCWNDAYWGERFGTQDISFSNPVSRTVYGPKAEVFLSGYNIRQVEKDDTNQHALMVRASITGVNGNSVSLQLSYAMEDKSIDTGSHDGNDKTKACIWYTVMASTKPPYYIHLPDYWPIFFLAAGLIAALLYPMLRRSSS